MSIINPSVPNIFGNINPANLPIVGGSPALNLLEFDQNFSAVLAYITTLGAPTVFSAMVSASMGASGNIVLPVGTFYVIPDTYGQIQINVAGPSGSASWLQLQATGVAGGGLIRTDGYTIRVLNTSGSVVSVLKYVPVTP